MTSAHLASLDWRKSSLSNDGSDCVEIARLPDRGGVAVRDSKDPDGGVLTCTSAGWRRFVGVARGGQLDAHV